MYAVLFTVNDITDFSLLFLAELSKEAIAERGSGSSNVVNHRQRIESVYMLYMERNKKDFRKTDKWEYALLGGCIAFYLLFPLVDGPVWCVDSAGYVSMHITREPLYPVFLALCRGIAGLCGMDALMIAVLLQSLLAAAAAWSVGWIVRRVKQDSRILQILAVVFQFAVTLLCRFAARRGSAYTDSILTEGLGFSLFVLFSVSLFLLVWTGKRRYLCRTLLLSFLLVSLRKQMMITLIVMGIVFLWHELIRNRRKWRCLCLIAMIFGVLFASKLFDRCYQYSVRGVWMEHSGNSMGILCTLLYSSDVERDEGLFEEEITRQLYREIMSQAEEQQLLYRYAEPGWLSVSSHYADSYDAIGYGIINPVVEGYIAEQFRYDEAEAAMKYDEICGAMSHALFRQPWMPLLQVYCYNLWKGLVNSIARAGRLLGLYAVTAYLAVGAAVCWLLRQRRKLTRPERQTSETCRALAEQIDATLYFTLIVMAGIVVNALVVGLIIFAQPRYMLYGMGLFYTACSMIVYDLAACLRHRHSVHTGEQE